MYLDLYLLLLVSFPSALISTLGLSLSKVKASGTACILIDISLTISLLPAFFAVIFNTAVHCLLS